MNVVRLIQGIMVKSALIVVLTVMISALLFVMGLHPNPLGIVTALLIVFFIVSKS